MTLISKWKLDENDNSVSSVVDSSGHANNHDLTSLTISTGAFGHKRFRTEGSSYFESVNNNSDFLVTGECTVMAWILPTVATSVKQWLVGVAGSGAGSAYNALWGLLLTDTGRFGMLWQYGSQQEVTAYCPNDTLPTDNFPDPIHIACVRSINATKRDVKFVLNGVDVGSDVTALTAPDDGASSICEMLQKPADTTDRLDDCDIWNVRFYDSAESVATILGIYNAELSEATRVSEEHDTSLLPILNGEHGEVYDSVFTGHELLPERAQSGWYRS